MEKAFRIATKFYGLREVPGDGYNSTILSFLNFQEKWPTNDETPWCAGFVTGCLHLADLPFIMSRSLMARSYLEYGESVDLRQARLGDLGIIKQVSSDPGKEVADFRGHIGFFAGYNKEKDRICLLAGNQNDSVSYQEFPATLLLDIRRAK